MSMPRLLNGEFYGGLFVLAGGVCFAATGWSWMALICGFGASIWFDDWLKYLRETREALEMEIRARNGASR